MSIMTVGELAQEIGRIKSQYMMGIVSDTGLADLQKRNAVLDRRRATLEKAR